MLFQHQWQENLLRVVNHCEGRGDDLVAVHRHIGRIGRVAQVAAPALKLPAAIGRGFQADHRTGEIAATRRRD